MAASQHQGSASGSGIDDLRALLQSTVGSFDYPATPSSREPQVEKGIATSVNIGGSLPLRGGQEKKSDIPVLDELASLIGSVDFDLNPSKKPKSIPVTPSRPCFVSYLL